MREWLKTLGRWWDSNIATGLFFLLMAATGVGYPVALIGSGFLAFAVGEYVGRRKFARWVRWTPNCLGWVLVAVGCYLALSEMFGYRTSWF